MKRKTFKVIFGLATCAFVSGCSIPSDSVNTYENKEKSGRVDIVQDKRVITDSFLKRRLLFKQICQSRTNDGLKRIQVFMKSGLDGFFDPDKPYKVVYRFNWYDNDGVQIEETDSEGWKTRLILPGDDVVFTTVAPSQECNDFKIRLKEIK